MSGVGGRIQSILSSLSVSFGPLIQLALYSLVRGGEARATALLVSKMTELHRVCQFLLLYTFLFELYSVACPCFGRA